MSCLIQEVGPGEALSAAAKVLLLLRRPHSVRVLIGGRHEAHPEILLRAGRQLWESGRGTGGNEPRPFKTSPDIWLLDGSGDLVNLLFFPMT